MTHVFGWAWDGAHWIAWHSSFSLQQRPLHDCVLHFHVVRARLEISQLRQSVQLLGGQVASDAAPLAESVTHVVTDKDPTREELNSPQTPPLSRGQLLLSKAANRQGSKGSASAHSILERAKELRVKLWNVSLFVRWVEYQLSGLSSGLTAFAAVAGLQQQAQQLQQQQQQQQQANTNNHGQQLANGFNSANLSSSNKAKTVAQPNIKVEDNRQRYKPQQKTLKEPYLHLDPDYPASPFDDPAHQLKFVKRERARRFEEINNNLVEKVQGKEVSKRKDDTGGGTGTVKKSTNPPKQQYCECCNAYFYHLDEHLQSEQHRKFFGASEEQFRCVRDLIDKLQPQWMGSLQPSLSQQQQQQQSRETLQHLQQVSEQQLSASLVQSLGQLEQQLAIASQGRGAEALLPLVGLESSLGLSALPGTHHQQQTPQKASSTAGSGRQSNNYAPSTTAAISAPLASNNNNNSSSSNNRGVTATSAAAASSTRGVNSLSSLAAVNSAVVGNGDMHPASAYALNMRQHMLNQAYRNATASGQPTGGTVSGVGAHTLLGRQGAPSTGHFDPAHGGHHANSGVGLKGGVPEGLEGLEGGASTGVGHRSVGASGAAASQTANPFQGLDLLSNTEQLLAAATAASSGVPLDFSRTAPPHHSLAAAMMRDLSAHLPTAPISHHAMLAAHHPHAAAYNLSQAAQHEKLLDDWLPKLQDQLVGVGHSGHHGGHHGGTGGQASSTQTLDMWNALGQDQSTAAQPNVLDLFAALGGTGDQDFAQLNLQNFLQVMTNVEEDRKRAQQIYNQAANAPTGGHHHPAGSHYQQQQQQQQQQQTTPKSKERHSHSQQSHQAQMSNQGNNSVAPPITLRAEIPDNLPDRVVNAEPSPKDKDFDTAGSKNATPSPQDEPQQTTQQTQQRKDRTAPSVQPLPTQDFDSPLQKSQYSSPMPKDDLPEVSLAPKKAIGQDDTGQHDSKGFSEKQIEMINQGLSELHKLIDQPVAVDDLPTVRPTNNAAGVIDESTQGPPSNNQQQAQDFPQTFTPEISGPQQAQNAFPDVVSPFDGQQGAQLTQQQVPTPQTHTPQHAPHTPQHGHHTPQHGHHTPQQGHHTPQQGHLTPQQQGHHTPQHSHTPQQGHTPQQQGHTTPYYEGGPRSVPPSGSAVAAGQMQNNPPSVPTTNPPSVPMSENGLTPQHTPQRHGPLTPQPMLHQPPTPHTPHTPMTPHTPLTPHNNQGDHMQSPAGLHGRATQQQQQQQQQQPNVPAAAATGSMNQMPQQQQPAMDQQQQATQGQANAIDKYDFQDDPLGGAPVDSQMASPWHQHQQQQQQVLPSLQMGADKSDWQSSSLPQFEAISSDNAKDGHNQGMVMTAMEQGMGHSGPPAQHHQQQMPAAHHHMSGHMANDNAAPVPAPYEKELPSKYLKGRGYQGYGQQQHGMGSGAMGIGGNAGLMGVPGGALSQESNDVVSSQDSNSLASSNANTPQHSDVHGTSTGQQQQTPMTSFGYHNETSKDSTDFAALEKKSYVQAIAQHHHQQQLQQQQAQHQQAGDSGSHNRWTAQRKAKRGRYGGIKLQFTPAGRNKSQGSASGGGPASYGSQHHSMFSPSQNNSHATPKGDPYDWNDEDEASLTPTIRKRNSRNSHATSAAPLSFSQFTQRQQQPQQTSTLPFHYQQFHEQQATATTSYNQQSYGHNQQQQQGYQQQQGQHYQHSGSYQDHQSQQSSSQYQQQQQGSQPQQSSSSSIATGSASQVSGSSTDPHDEWKMKMVSETKIVLKKFSLSSGGKPMSYSKHPRKRHI